MPAFIFASYSLSPAYGALKALGEAGRRVPQDISVIGFDGDPLRGRCGGRKASGPAPAEGVGRIRDTPAGGGFPLLYRPGAKRFPYRAGRGAAA
ncbi:MAG: substrate-binding domain-containing protein [Treponema sp.]|jgi:hypothetical protein|nr:substrate-binding domain-containing protein [Treponema sp.]